jgi:hypothetical protein
VNTGADVVYNWPTDEGDKHTWSASGKKSTKAKSCSG